MSLLTTTFQDNDLQNLWLASLNKPWSALALLPCSPSAPVERWVHQLAQTGARLSGESIESLLACGCTQAQLPELMADLKAKTSRGKKVLVALDPLSDNPCSLPLALAAEAAVLCITLGQTDEPTARTALKLLGKERFVGSLCWAQPTLR